MGLLAFGKKRMQAKIDREVLRWAPPKTKGGSQVETAVFIYTVAVAAMALLLLSVMPATVAARLVVLGAAVVALSGPAKQNVIPRLYALLAPRMGWGEFRAAIDQEAEARGLKADASKPVEDQPAPAPKAGALDEQASAILKAYCATEKTDRQLRALKVVQVLSTRGVIIEGLDDAENEAERVLLADVALRRLAQRNGLLSGSAA